MVPDAKSLVPIKPSGCKRPFFYVHGADGHTVDSLIGKYIDPDRPFYGLRAVGRDGKEPPHTSVEAMAAYYVQEIQTVQPKGPYLLGGRCTGGTIALEMAYQLKKKRQDVLLVVMVDSPRPLVAEAEKAEYLRIAACEETRKKWMETLIKIGSDFSQGKFDFNPEVFKYGIQIPAIYTPHIYGGEIAYFVAQDNGRNGFLSNLIKPQAWNNFVRKEILINEVPGDHLSMTKEPNIKVLAFKLSSCLDKAGLITKQHNQDKNQPNFKEDLEEKGYTILSFLNQQEIQHLIKVYQGNPFPEDAVTESPYLYRSDSSLDRQYRHQVTQEVKKIFSSKVERIFSDYKIVSGIFIYKPQNSPSIALHQDPSIVDEALHQSLTIWCPLIDVDEQRGCLQIVEKSHLITSSPRPYFVYTGSNCDLQLVSLMQQHYLTSLSIHAGQAVIFDGRLFHGSAPNQLTNERISVYCQIVPKDSAINFVYRDSKTSHKVEIFEVDDDFYEGYVKEQRPDKFKQVRVLNHKTYTSSQEELVRLLEEKPPKGIQENPERNKKIRSLFNLFRGQDWWFYKIPPLLAIAYAEILIQNISPHTAATTLLALIASMFFVAAYGHVVNDIFDIEVDRRADKANRMGLLPISQRILLSLSLAVAGLVPWFFTGFSTQSALLLAGIYTLLTIYSAPPLRLKEKGLLGVITDATAVHAVPTLFVATVFSQLANSPEPRSITIVNVATLWAFLVGIRGIVLHQIWDRENDVTAGINTWVVKVGTEVARARLLFLIFPCEMLLLCLLMFLVSQFAPFSGVFFILYIVLRAINTKVAPPNALDPAPIRQVGVPAIAHDFYEAWLPLALLVLLSVRETEFIPLLALHIVLFYPAIVKRSVEFNPLLLTVRKAITTLISSMRHQPVGKIDSWQLAKTEVPTETFTESPSNDLERSIARSVDFLASSQLNDGEFKTEIHQSREMHPGEFVKEWVFDSSPFATSLVLYSLSFLKHESKVKQITERGLKFLLGEMEFNGLWRYWSSKNPQHQMIPPDLDDICCISYILRMHNISYPSNTKVLLANRNQQGMFYTWLLPRSLKTIFLNLKTSGKALSYSNELWKLTNKDDVCCVVNANALLYLGENQQTQVIINHLINTVLEGNEDSCTAFYAHRFSFYYMLSRAYFNGVHSLGVVKTDLTNRVLSLQKADGSFGNELLTALAICTLLNLNYYTPSLENAVDFLLKTQQPDGAWQRIPMYGGQPDKPNFGSAELTTAFCLEALARYRLLDGVGKLQHNRTELKQVQAQFQQTEQELTQVQSQLHTIQTELAQVQSELQTSKTELARLRSYLHQTQGASGAIDYYRHAIATHPDDLSLYNQALEICPNDVQIHLQLGNALVRQGQITEAIDRYQTVLQFHPDHFELHFELAKTLEKEKRWDEAIAAYQRAIELNPNHSLAHQHLGNALAEHGQLHEASIAYRRVLQLQASH